MEFNEVIRKRFSTRAYKPDQISSEQLDAILYAGATAPVGMGEFEDMHLVVIQDAALLAEIDAAAAEHFGNPKMKAAYGAPTLIIIASRSSGPNGEKAMSAACVADHMLLAATDQGLASVFLIMEIPAFLKNPDLLAKLELPEGFKPTASVGVGFPDGPLPGRRTDGKQITIKYL